MIDWYQIAMNVTGTCDGPATIAERYEVDEDDVEHELGEHGVETCEGCGWWFAGAGVGTGSADLLCEDCR